MSIRLASGSNWLLVTVHGGGRPSACCSRVVSRMVIHPQAPILTQPGAVLAAVKDAKRRAKGAVAKRPSLTAPARAALCVVRPGRRNGPFQPNKETTLKWVALAARARKGHACHPFQTARRRILAPARISSTGSTQDW